LVIISTVIMRIYMAWCILRKDHTILRTDETSLLWSTEDIPVYTELGKNLKILLASGRRASACGYQCLDCYGLIVIALL